MATKKDKTIIELALAARTVAEARRSDERIPVIGSRRVVVVKVAVVGAPDLRATQDPLVVVP
ncbi:MAG: hypothetical protein ABFS30_03655, partial [Pseudomonadota bacterium]